MNYMHMMTSDDDVKIPKGMAVLYIDNNGFVGTNNGWPINGIAAFFPESQAEIILSCWTYMQLYHPNFDEMPHPEAISIEAKKWLTGEGSFEKK